MIKKRTPWSGPLDLRNLKLRISHCSSRTSWYLMFLVALAAIALYWLGVTCIYKGGYLLGSGWGLLQEPQETIFQVEEMGLGHLGYGWLLLLFGVLLLLSSAFLLYVTILIYQHWRSCICVFSKVHNLTISGIQWSHRVVFLAFPLIVLLTTMVLCSWQLREECTVRIRSTPKGLDCARDHLILSREALIIRKIANFVAKMTQPSTRKIASSALLQLLVKSDRNTNIITKITLSRIRQRLEDGSPLLQQIEELFLVATLWDSSVHKREQAVINLGRLGSPGAVAALAKSLTDVHPRVRKAAVNALAKLHQARVILPLGRTLKVDEDPDVRQAALQALIQLRQAAALPYIVAAFRDPQPQVRLAAVHFLKQAPPEQIELILSKALLSPYPQVRKAALERAQSLGAQVLPLLLEHFSALPTDHQLLIIAIAGRNHTPAALNFLKKLCASKEVRLRRAAVTALAQWHRPVAELLLVAHLKDSDSRIRQICLQALAQTRDPGVIQAVIRMYHQSTAMGGRFANMLRGLLQKLMASLPADHQMHGMIAETFKLDQLQQGSEEEKLQAIRFLANTGTSLVLLKFAQMYLDEDAPRVQQALQSALARMAGRNCPQQGKILQPELAKILAQDYNQELIHKALALIRLLACSGYTPLLCKYLNYRKPELRRDVIQTLGEVADQRAVGPLVNLLRTSTDAATKLVVQKALGRIQRRSSKPHPQLQQLENETLSKLEIAVDRNAQKEALKLLAQIGTSQCVMPIIQRYLRSNSQDLELQILAVQTLAMVKAKEAVSVLVDRLARDTPTKLRRAAAVALGAIGDARAFKPLYNAYLSAPAALQVPLAEALSKCTNRENAMQLLRLLESPNPTIRSSVSQALKRLLPKFKPETWHYVKIAAHLQKERLRWGAHHEKLEAIATLQALGAESHDAVRQETITTILLESLNAKFPDVRIQGALALGQVGNTKAVLPLSLLLKNDYRPAVKKAAIKALKNLRQRYPYNQAIQKYIQKALHYQ